MYLLVHRAAQKSFLMVTVELSAPLDTTSTIQVLHLLDTPEPRSNGPTVSPSTSDDVPAVHVLLRNPMDSGALEHPGQVREHVSMR